MSDFNYSKNYLEWCAIMQQSPNTREAIIFDAGYSWHALNNAEQKQKNLESKLEDIKINTISFNKKKESKENKMIYLATIYLKTNDEIFIDMMNNIAELNDCIRYQKETPEYHNIPFICRLVEADNDDEAFEKVERHINLCGLETITFEISDMII